MSGPESVKFNVGGQPYQVARSLLESYPGSMLAKLASENRSQQEDDPTATFFINRDGEYYRHVLHYLRDERVHLPLTMTKKALLAELEYYGLEGVKENEIQDGFEQQIPKLITRVFLQCSIKEDIEDESQYRLMFKHDQ